ncbi:TlpA family protein disulfide reductase [Luedemannella flava]
MLTVVVLIDLLLSAAIIRRLRDTEAHLADLMPSAQPGLKTGTPMPDFTSADGSLTRAALAGTPVIFGFFSTGCRYCPTQAEQLAHRAAEIAERGLRVINVVAINDESIPDDITPVLEKSGTVVAEQGMDNLMAAFSVTSTPTFLLYDGRGTLIAKGNHLEETLERWIQ